MEHRPWNERRCFNHSFHFSFFIIRSAIWPVLIHRINRSSLSSSSHHHRNHCRHHHHNEHSINLQTTQNITFYLIQIVAPFFVVVSFIRFSFVAIFFSHSLFLSLIKPTKPVLSLRSVRISLSCPLHSLFALSAALLLLAPTHFPSHFRCFVCVGSTLALLLCMLVRRLSFLKMC